jgi:ornithine--oxo-acid transaminase
VIRTDARTAGELVRAEAHTAHNYHPLPVVIADGEGAWVTDVDGNRYLDCLAGYSSLNFGHRHPALIAAAKAQLDRVTLTSRAFVHDQFGAFCEELAALCGTDLVLPRSSRSPPIRTPVPTSARTRPAS